MSSSFKKRFGGSGLGQAKHQLAGRTNHRATFCRSTQRRWLASFSRTALSSAADRLQLFRPVVKPGD